MGVWLVRAGAGGERENYALENKVAVIGWEKLGDLSGIKTREALLERLENVYPDVKHKARLMAIPPGNSDRRHRCSSPEASARDRFRASVRPLQV